jgi:tetratricopeptide (TPR) repeat protein
VAAAAVSLRVLATSSSAGFSLPVKWYQYGFTQARAIFTYIRLALIPLGQSLDHDYPISRTIWEYGAIVYLLLLGALSAFCIVRRRRYPLACFGLLMTLILLAPTSSIVPISDPLVERRMYLPLVGLILIGCELAKREYFSLLTRYAAVVAMLVMFAVLCYQRNQLWSQPSQLWVAAAIQSTTKVRPYINLVDQLIQEQRCNEAIPYLQHADQIFPNSYAVQMSWGRTLQCVGRQEEALNHLRRAVALEPSSYVYQLIGLLYGEMGNYAEAGLALQKAVESDPNSASAHNAFGLWHEAVADLNAAEKEYRASLALDRNDHAANVGIARVRQAKLNQ